MGKDAGSLRFQPLERLLISKYQYLQAANKELLKN